eukprot:1512727-Rhodomonas_salina.1
MLPVQNPHIVFSKRIVASHPSQIGSGSFPSNLCPPPASVNTLRSSTPVPGSHTPKHSPRSASTLSGLSGSAPVGLAPREML